MKGGMSHLDELARCGSEPTEDLVCDSVIIEAQNARASSVGRCCLAPLALEALTWGCYGTRGALLLAGNAITIWWVRDAYELLQISELNIPRAHSIIVCKLGYWLLGF